MLRLSDARMSGTSYGACVLHVAPEAFRRPVRSRSHRRRITSTSRRARSGSTSRTKNSADAVLHGPRRRPATNAASAGSRPSTSPRPTKAATSISSRRASARRWRSRRSTDHLPRPETSAKLAHAESTPGASAEADPGLRIRRGGDAEKWILRVGRPVASPRFSRPGLIGRGASSHLDHRSSGTLCGVAPWGKRPSGALLAPCGRARLVVAGGRMLSAFRPAPHGAFRREALQSPAAARVGRHRAPAAGPPPLRLHDPVRTRLLAGGEWRQRTMAGNRWAIIWLTYQESGAIGFGRQAGTSRRRRAHLRDGGGGRARAREL